MTKNIASDNFWQDYWFLALMVTILVIMWESSMILLIIKAI